MALTLGLVLPAPMIAGSQNQTATLSVQNTGGSDVTISSIACGLGTGAAGYCGQPSITPSTSLVVAASATNYYPFTLVALTPAVAGAVNSAAPQLNVIVAVYSNDATTPVASINRIVGVAAELPFTQAQFPTSPGWLDFTQPPNTGLVALGML